MEFKPDEIVFFAIVTIAGVCGAAIRLGRDEQFGTLASVAGRSLAGGVWSFGIVGYWIGRHSDGVVSPWLYLGVATLVGYASGEIHEVFKRFIFPLLRRWLINAGLLKDEDQIT